MPQGMPQGILEHTGPQSELSHGDLKYTKNAISLPPVGWEDVCLPGYGNSVGKPWWECQLEAVWSPNSEQPGQQVLPWSGTSVSAKVLFQKPTVMVSNEVGYIQISLTRTHVFKKVWKTSKMYNSNQSIGRTLQITFFSQKYYWNLKHCHVTSFLKAWWTILLCQSFGLLCPKRHLTFSMADCGSLFPLRYCEFLIFHSLSMTSGANYLNKFHLNWFIW